MFTSTLRVLALAAVLVSTQGLCAEEIVLEDFESASYGKWLKEGDAFGNAPAKGTLPNQHPVGGFLGKGLVNTFLGGDAATGKLTSPEFSVSHDYVAVLVGGGNHPGEVGVELVTDAGVVRSATGTDSEALDWQVWEVRELRGQKAQIRIIDQATGGWGHINVDQIIFTDSPRVGGVDIEEYRGSPGYMREPYRPQFHFTPEVNWMNDPNGLVYFGGEYHLFYQYNPFGNAWGHMSWGHAVSTDLTHWKHLPVALYEENGKMIFSGCAVVDRDNTSGFGSGSEPPLVAVYTGHRKGNQSQCLAYSNDKGRTWTKYADNPVLDIGEADFRDPKVFWHEPTERWVMVVSMAIAKRIQFYGSTDLKKWDLLSEFGPAGAPDKPNWECPDLFELRIEGQSGKTRWVLEVDMGGAAAAGGSGGEYFIGHFDGQRFTCDHLLDEVRWVDYGRDFYAPVSWSDIPESDGRRIWIGWMNNWETHLLPTKPWRSAMSVPRVLSLRETPDGLRLIQKPVRELEQLRGKRHAAGQIRLTKGEPWKHDSLQGQTLEIVAEFEPADAKVVGIRFRMGDGQAAVVGYDAEAGRVFVDRRDSGETDFHEAFPGSHGGPLRVKNNRVRIHAFIDSSSVEVFGNDGETVITSRIFPDAESTGCEVFAEGGDAVLRSIEWWPVRSIWHAERSGE